MQVVVTHEGSGAELQYGKSMLSLPESMLFAGAGPPHAVSVKATPRQCTRADLSRNPANVSTREPMPQSGRSVNASREHSNVVNIRVVEGDRARLDLSPYDLNRARITSRLTGPGAT